MTQSCQTIIVFLFSLVNDWLYIAALIYFLSSVYAALLQDFYSKKYMYVKIGFHNTRFNAAKVMCLQALAL